MPTLDGLEARFTERDQDKFINTIMHDTKFLSQCIRRGVNQNIFSSKVRQQVIGLIMNYYGEHSAAPSDNIEYLVMDDLIKSAGSRDIDEDTAEMYIAYLGKLDKLPEVPASFFLKRLDEFIKERVVRTTANSLVKMQDRFGTSPDKAIELMRKALEDVDTATANHVIESFREGYDDDDAFTTDTVTKFNVAPLDSALGGGLKKGSYVIIVGYTNVGKSWAAVHLAKLSTRLGNTPLIIPLEMSNKILKLRLRMCYSGMTAEELKTNGGGARATIHKSMIKHSDVLLLPDDEKSMRVDQLPSLLDEIKDKYGLRANPVIFDSADDLAPPAGHYKGDIERSTAIHTYLKNYAKDNDICIITTCQAQRRGETKYWITAGTVADNINKIRKATVGISISATPAEIKANYARLYLFKHTTGSVGTQCYIKSDFKHGQFIDSYGEYVHAAYKQKLKDEGVWQDVDSASS